MGKFNVSFNGRPEDLLRQIGMSLNTFIKKIVGIHDTKPLRTTFLRPENAESDWIRTHVVHQVSLALQCRPNETRTFDMVKAWVRETYDKDVRQWIEDNRELLAELGFIRDENEAPVRFDKYGRRIVTPPATIR